MIRSLWILLVTVVLTILFPISCSFSSGTEIKEINPGENWSVKMADAVLARNENLLKYNGAEHLKWQYDVAFLGMALDRLGHVNPDYSISMEHFMDYFIQEDGSINGYDPDGYNLEDVNPAKNLITLYKRTGEERYRRALDTIISQLQHQPRTRSGGFWQQETCPWQVWLEGLYMAAPFMAQYAREFGEPSWFDEAVFQLVHVYERTHDEKTGLLYQAWDESRSQQWCDPETGLSRYLCGRSVGWYMMALVDVLDFLPGDHPGRRKILEILVSTSEALTRVRDPRSKLWFQVLDQGGSDGNYLEASSNAMFIYVFAKASGKGYLDQHYLMIAQESFQGMLEHFVAEDEDGWLTINHIMGGYGPGGNPNRDGGYQYYMNEELVDNDPRGIAAFILAAIELNR